MRQIRHNPDPSRSTQFHWLAPGIIGLILSSLGTLHAEPADRASTLVQSALRAEIAPDGDRRARLLEEALTLDPDRPEVHWARGDVRIDGRWKSLESAAADATGRANLKQYREQRRQTDATPEGQARLAGFCSKHHLSEQERAHWKAVLALAPDHAQARQRLGQVNQQGTWVDEGDLNRQKDAAREAAEYLQTHRKTLTRLVHSLSDKTLPRGQIVAELQEFDNPLVIPVLEQQFSSRGEAGALCTVEALDSLAAPAASLSLVRHALGFPAESVRTAAADALRRRDEHSFIPPLLASLQSPVVTRDEFSFAAGNRLIWRQSLLVDKRDVQQAATLDRVFLLQGVIPDAAALTANASRGAIAARTLELDRLNAAIESYNQRVGELLAYVTRSESSRTPEEWWSWWNDRIESFPSEPKAVRARYEQQQQYSLVLPRIPEPPRQSTFTSRARSERSECLAPGTPVWTETGPVAIDLLKTGDLVLAQNPRSGELKFAPVLAATNRPPELLLRLNLGSEVLRATGGHPFWVAGQGWIKARSLKPGMALHTARGLVVLDSVEEDSEPTKAFNLIVDDCHSYFVGASLILSHDNTVREPVVNRVPGLREDVVDLTR